MSDEEVRAFVPIAEEFVAAVSERDAGFVFHFLESHSPDLVAVTLAGMLDEARTEVAVLTERLAVVGAEEREKARDMVTRVNQARFLAVKDARIRQSAAEAACRSAEERAEVLTARVHELMDRVEELRGYLYGRKSA